LGEFAGARWGAMLFLIVTIASKLRAFVHKPVILESTACGSDRVDGHS
jgi:hypothetical protein